MHTLIHTVIYPVYAYTKNIRYEALSFPAENIKYAQQCMRALYHHC